MNTGLERLLGVPRLELRSAWMPALVTFLVGLPLALGVSVASGLPAMAGLWSAIIGGLVVGRLAGSPLQVTGPAAGLVVVVFDIVQRHGVEGLAVVTLLTGGLQLVGGVLRLGRWFRAVSPAVVHGMLAGIGIAIVAGQLHALVGQTPTGHTLDDLLSLPHVLASTFSGGTWWTAGVGLTALLGIVWWQLVRPATLREVPGALAGVVLASVAALALGLDVVRVTLPEGGLFDGLVPLRPERVVALATDASIWSSVMVLTAVASIEAMLSATATDSLHDGVRTDYERELMAQGVGNVLAGMVGALPMSGAVVRNAANVRAGATDRLPAMIHALAIALVAGLAPWLLATVPMAALAAVLVVAGARLVEPRHVVQLWRTDRVDAGIMLATTGTVVAVDLLAGVLLGMTLAVGRVLWHQARLRVHIDLRHERKEAVVTLAGAATFLAVPHLADALASIPDDYGTQIVQEDLEHVDRAVLDLFQAYSRQRPAERQVACVVRSWQGRLDAPVLEAS